MTPADSDPVARTLARAFYDDPHFRWIVRDDARRMERMVRGFRTFIERIWLRHDESYVHERLVGAALWMPPETWHLGVVEQLRLLPAILASVRGDSGRLLKAVNWMERKHPHERHWYLPAIGVTTSWQGRGYGAALLRPMLERCDSERLPAYLEASTPRNRALYERHGFEVVEEGRYAENGPPIWRMWREPR
ncbi:MAG TPA: GNAT family N-acetyltransferase [Solirubrobacteraceae bacterium]|jgi:GNAT superfamily N-acetyltransferase